MTSTTEKQVSGTLKGSTRRSTASTMKPFTKITLTIIGLALLNETTIISAPKRHLQEELDDEQLAPPPPPPGIIRVPMWTNPDVNSDEDEPDTLPATRRLQTEDIPEHGDGHGTHFVGLYVGSPVQKRTMTVNTNSDFTALPCLGCTECGRAKPFDQYKSSTFDQLKCSSSLCSAESRCVHHRCEISDTYQDMSSFNAYETQDYVYIGGSPGFNEANPKAAQNHGFPLVFGCQTMSRGWFRTHATDGMLGLGPSPTSFLSQMYKHGKLADNSFSLCFSHKLAEMGDGSSSGALTLGGFDTRYHDSPVVFAENTPGPGYTVFLNKIYLREKGGQSVTPDDSSVRVIPVDFNAREANRNGEGIHLDTGTPFTSLPESIESSFRRVWRRITGQEFSYGRVRLLDGDLLRLPTILFQFRADASAESSGLDPYTVTGMAGDVDPQNPYDLLVAVPATHYMEFNPSNGYYRPRITFEKDRSYIGSSLMQGHDVNFDVSNGRIGVAEVSVCIPRPTHSATADDDLFDTPGDVRDDDGFWKGQLGSSRDQARSDDDGVGGYGPLEGVVRGRPLGPGSVDSIYGFGTCTRMTCKIWIFVGYVAAIMFAFVIWKCAHIKRPDEDEFGEDPFADDIEIEAFETHGGDGVYRDSADLAYDDRDDFGLETMDHNPAQSGRNQLV